MVRSSTNRTDPPSIAPRISSRLPLPSSVYLFNAFTSGRSAAGDDECTDSLPGDRHTNATGSADGGSLTASSDGGGGRWFRPEPSVDLLQSIRLDFVTFSRSGEQRLLYSRLGLGGTVQPVWHHLNEPISEPTMALTVEEYETMTIRLHLDGCPNPEARDGGNNKGHEPSLPMLLWQEYAIHPSKLSRIGRLPTLDKTPLPINFVVVAYTDGSYRVAPSQLQAVADADFCAIPKSLPSDDQFGRFKDTVFKTLDSVTPPASTASRNLEASVPGPQTQLRNRVCSTDSTNSKTTSTQSGTEDESVQPVPSWGMVRNERKILLEQILHEERVVQCQKDQLREQEHQIHQLQTLLVGKQHEQTPVIRLAVQRERQRADEAAFGMQAQQIRLVTELQSLFPIHAVVTGESHRYYIRGLELPITSGEILFGVADEDLAAALGYLCHLIHLLSKYLAVQLRYRLLCHNSRSGIQDDRAILYPLFLQSRTAAEREQVEHAIRLLHRNVECLLRERGVLVSTKLHILGKVKRIYEHVIEGY